MNVNKKFDRFKQWAGERMGGEIKTTLTDDFKARETEMNVRQEGLDRIHKSMTAYVKSISKRGEADDKEKLLPVTRLGTSMVAHGDDYDGYSEYGRSLCMLGRTEERLGRVQENYINQATATYLEALERSLAQMKEYQAARKRLDSRRLAYDASLSKMQKAKKEDFRVEEELRTQKVKYEEANEDVIRRMQDIKDAEAEGSLDLAAFLDAQLSYHDKCREMLLQVQNEWPGNQGTAQTPTARRTGRARSATAHSYNDRYEPLHEEPPNTAEQRPTIRSSSRIESPMRDACPAETVQRPGVVNRPFTFEGPTQLRQERQWPPRSTENQSSRSPIRPASTDPYADVSEETSSHSGTSRERSVSPATSHGSVMSRTTSSSTLNGVGVGRRPPPPPPPRSKKPAPPPPMKKPLLAAGDA